MFSVFDTQSALTRHALRNRWRERPQREELSYVNPWAASCPVHGMYHAPCQNTWNCLRSPRPEILKVLRYVSRVQKKQKRWEVKLQISSCWLRSTALWLSMTDKQLADGPTHLAESFHAIQHCLQMAVFVISLLTFSPIPTYYTESHKNSPVWFCSITQKLLKVLL